MGGQDLAQCWQSLILSLNPAVNTSLSRPQLDVTWPHKWIIEGPQNYIGVGVARSQGQKSAGTI